MVQFLGEYDDVGPASLQAAPAVLPAPAAPVPHASLRAETIIDCGGQRPPAGLNPLSFTGAEFRWIPGGNILSAVRLFALEGVSGDFVLTAADCRQLGEFLVDQSRRIDKASKGRKK